MNSHLLAILIFVLGVSIGWFGKTWLGSLQSEFSIARTDEPQLSITQTENAQTKRGFPNSNEPSATIPSTTISLSNSLSQSNQNNRAQSGELAFTNNSTEASISDNFARLLANRQYKTAMTIYQEKSQLNSPFALQLRQQVLKELKRLSEVRNNADFAALIESYLSIHYDDIDALLLLADFHQNKGNYLEVVNVYLLAKTYAYSPADELRVANRFNHFVEKIDSFYTTQKTWRPLLDLYSHISTSGLITPALQYQQAIAHLRSGEKFFAIEQLNQLLNDSEVGEAAEIALSNLSGTNNLPRTTDTPDTNTSPGFDSATEIKLQKSGNQYLVKLANSRQDSVQLLIDTGASMTAMSRASFDVLNANGDAVEQEQREFNTAAGVIIGTVFSVPELVLGPYPLIDTQIAVIDFDPQRNIGGLLGMNILDQFQFQIDQENARLLLSQKGQP